MSCMEMGKSEGRPKWTLKNERRQIKIQEERDLRVIKQDNQVWVMLLGYKMIHIE